MNRVKGTVTRVFLTRGFAFVRGDDDQDYFLHVDQLDVDDEWESVRKGVRIEFVPARVAGAKQNGLRAEEAKLC